MEIFSGDENVRHSVVKVTSIEFAARQIGSRTGRIERSIEGGIGRG